MMESFVAICVGITSFIIWNIIRLKNAQIAKLSSSQAEGFLNEIAKKAKEEIDKKSLQDIADDFARRYPIESPKHTDDHS